MNAYAQHIESLGLSERECNAAMARARRYRVEPLDALHTLAEWQLSGRPVKWSTVLTRISRQHIGLGARLDQPIGDGITLGETVAQSPLAPSDDTALRALHYSVRRGIITGAQAGVIWAHVCEEASLSQIGRAVGHADHTTARYHLRRGLAALRKVCEEAPQ